MHILFSAHGSLSWLIKCTAAFLFQSDVPYAGGCMGGNKLDSAAVRKLEKLPTKKQLIGSVAIMVKKVGQLQPCLYLCVPG